MTATKTENFTLYSDAGLEPVIGWIGNKPVNPDHWLPITPAQQNTATGKYVLAFIEENRQAAHYWAIENGVITYYDANSDDAFNATGV